MASATYKLDQHWEAFIEREVASGRYSSASEVVQAALRGLEEHNERLEALRAHLAAGAEQAARGEFVPTPDARQLVERAKARQ